MKKLVTLFWVVGFMACLLGCCNNENSSLYLVDVSETKEISVNANGQFSAPIVFDSGDDCINTTEDNTLKEDVIVNVTKTKTYDIGRNPIGRPDYIYLYGITAELVDSLGHRTEVSSLEKPLRLTLSTTHLGTEGVCYVGIRERGSNSSWKYSRVSDDGNVFLGARSLRASTSEKLLPKYDFMLFKMGVELALFVYNKPPEEARNDISSTGLTASAATLLELGDDKKYVNDLDMSIKLEGENLSKLSKSDLNLTVTYRTSNKEPVTIKSKGDECRQKTEEKSDAAVTGDSRYVHTLNVSNFDVSFGGQTEIHFTLDLKGISSSDFPTDFLLDVSSVDNIENLIPFCYSNKINAEKPVFFYTIVYDLDGGSLAEEKTNPINYSTASPTFTLNNPVKEGYTFIGWTGTGLTETTKEVIITKGSTGDRKYKAIWVENLPDAYILTVTKGTGIATVSDSGSYKADEEITLEYTLEDGYQFVSWTSDDVQVDESNRLIMPAKDVTVKANAEVITYSISYDGIDDAVFEDGVINPDTYDVTSDTIVLNNPTRTGYIFAGWTGTEIEEGSASMTVTIPQGSTGERSYVAKWTVASYTIVYELNGGSLAEGDTNPDTYDVTSDAITLKNPVYGGYPFKGWSGTDLEGDENQTVTIAQGSTGDRTYTANWVDVPITYTITYELNEGILATDVVNPVTYDVTSANITLNNPTREGYTFKGWSGTDLEGDENQTVTIAQGSTGDKTYIANWSPISYAITYNLNEGSLAASDANPETYYITSERIVLNNPTRTNYDFLGWTGTEIEDGTASMTVTIPQGSIGDRNYVASWTPQNFTITYELNGGSLADGVTNPETYSVTSEAITLNNPVKGYPFKGWSGTDLEGDENQTVTIAQGSTGDRTYTANWVDVPITYTITYELNEGILATGAVNPVTYDVTSADIILNNPIREGYTFKGWNGTDLEGDENQTVTIVQGSFGDKTYTANWIPISYAINCDLAGGNLADGVTNPVAYDITSTTITLNNPVREDYYFEGWTGTGIEEGTVAETVTIPQGSMGERNYVASWTLMTIRLTIPGSTEVVTFQRPQHTDDFFMAIYEVTKSQYEAINGSGSDPSYHTVSSSHPVDFVDWNNANSTCEAFTQMLRDVNTLPEGFLVKLPTYNQWMYTCYAGSEDDYCFGVDGEQVIEATLSDYAVYDNPSYTSAVGSKKPNYWGFYDMHGNVYEWILDNPPGIMIFGMHFKFGGSWNVNAASCNAWPIVMSGSAPVAYDVGFRFALVPSGE